jgi:cytochrome bd-I ubiquinol oxidase subunit X
MWYFSWILGLGFACTFAVLNAMWLELRTDKPASPGRGASKAVTNA